MKKKVLIISTFFPPRAHTATQRVLAWVKYLDRNLFDISILTPMIPDRDIPKLEKEFGVNILELPATKWPGVIEIKNEDSKLIRFLKVVHNKIFINLFFDEWPSFTKKGKKFSLEKANEYDIIISSFAPVSPHLIAYSFKKLNPSVVWAADFRDEMSVGDNIPILLRWFLFRLEKKIIKKADLIFSVSDPILQDFRRHDSGKKFFEIKNGYDFSPDFSQRTTGDRIRIGYLGTFYGQREPGLFFNVLNEYKTLNCSPQVEVYIYGKKPRSEIPDNLKDCVHYLNGVSYEKVPGILKELDVFLLIQPTSSRKGVFTSKLFDYLAINRPILALVDPNDVAGELISKLNAGFVQDYSEFTLDSFRAFLKSVELKDYESRNQNLILSLSRKNQVEASQQLIIERLV